MIDLGLIYITGTLPRNCSECQLAQVDTNFHLYCPKLGATISDTGRTENCPLRSLVEYEKSLKEKFKNI